MLSRTADHLFWMARYTERAENTARILDANWQLSLLPQSDEYAAAGWRAMLSISELADEFAAKHTQMTSADVIAFMSSDTGNLSSILCCLRAARENARAVRSEITTELWETINTTWLECQRLLADGILRRDPSEFFEWVKFRSHLSRGIEFGTMVKDDAFHFLRLGTFIERADNTARLLDIKCAMPEVRGGAGGSASFDYYHWSAVLRSVSGNEAYHKIYRDVLTPERVANLLILHRDWPRSLAANIEEVHDLIGRLRIARSTGTERAAAALWAELRDGSIREILRCGLHTYLTDFLARINDLASRLSHDFLVPIVEEAGDAGAQATAVQVA